MTRWIQAVIDFFFGLEPRLCGRRRSATQLIICGMEDRTPMTTIELTIGGTGRLLEMKPIVAATGEVDSAIEAARWSFANPDIVENVPQAYLDGGSAGLTVTLRPGNTPGVVTLYASCDAIQGEGERRLEASITVITVNPPPPDADTLEIVVTEV